MEWLIGALPIALALLLCVGLHGFMMRRMHSGHGGISDDTVTHDSHHLGPKARLAQLERQVAELKREVANTGRDGAPDAGASNAASHGAHCPGSNGHREGHGAIQWKERQGMTNLLRRLLGGDEPVRDPVCSGSIESRNAGPRRLCRRDQVGTLMLARDFHRTVLPDRMRPKRSAAPGRIPVTRLKPGMAERPSRTRR